MVVFTCGYCGESVQKPKVEKHYTATKCRNRNPNLSCMDCFKDFLGNSYEEHTKCITEEERYSGKGFVAKEKKGERKQSTWIDLVQSVLDEQQGAPKNVLRIIETISKHNNTPRKKPKFFNFVKNVCGNRTSADEIEQAWNLISPKLAALSNANQRSQNQANNKSDGSEENSHDTENSNNQHTKSSTDDDQNSEKGKKERIQSTWTDLVQSVLDEHKGAPKNVLKIIETISKHHNTPRKKPKFFNFVKNVCGAKTGAKEIEQAWDLISPKFDAMPNVNQGNNSINGTENGHDTENLNNQDESSQNSQETISEEVTENCPTEDKKLSKKERKEQKKRQKYEAELQSAEAPHEEIIDEEEETKKGKKKKNRTESTTEEPQEGKKNKRKRQDTVNSVSSNQEMTEGAEVQNGTAKTQKKKAKVEEDAEESMCLHDQNVAKISELTMSDKFNWHGVIMSVLQKKGNELPFKRLQKKVLAEYSESTGREIDDRIADKFIKKLKSAPNVRVDKNKVMLLD